MLVYRIEGIIGESLCTDENDRNAVAEMKHKYANRSEVFNNRLDKRGYIFIANISEGIITLGALVQNWQEVSVIVDSYIQHSQITMNGSFARLHNLWEKKGVLSLLRRLWEKCGLYLDIYERKMTLEMVAMCEVCWSRHR